jgi:NADPH:quinone reductase-like Zn-dependent oxidoreductase
METSSMRAVIAESANNPSLKTVNIPTPGDNQVLVHLRSTTINPSDTGFLDGHLFGPSFPTGLGFEGFGKVTASGKGGEHLVGKLVCFWSLQARAWADYTIVPIRDLMTLPDDTTQEVGTFAYLNPVTCHGLFSHVLSGNHKGAIITVAASQCGRILTRLCRAAGIKAIAVVRKDDQKQICTDCGADAVLNSSDSNFFEQVRTESEKLNATILIDCINGSFTANLLKEMPFGSRAFVYGFLSGESNINLDATDFFMKSKSIGCFFITYWLNTLNDTQLEEVHNKVRETLLTSGKTDISKRFEYEHFSEALEYYRNNSAKGKVLININK